MGILKRRVIETLYLALVLKKRIFLLLGLPTAYTRSTLHLQMTFLKLRLDHSLPRYSLVEYNQISTQNQKRFQKITKDQSNFLLGKTFMILLPEIERHLSFSTPQT